MSGDRTSVRIKQFEKARLVTGIELDRDTRGA